jgi:hypothetical protein
MVYDALAWYPRKTLRREKDKATSFELASFKLGEGVAGEIHSSTVLT